MPALDKGGNIVQPFIEAKLSIHCSPYTAVFSAADEVKEIIKATTNDHVANVTFAFAVGGRSTGFAAAPLPTWKKSIVNEAAVPIFGAEMLGVGKGGTSGFLATIQKEARGIHYPQHRSLCSLWQGSRSRQKVYECHGLHIPRSHDSGHHSGGGTSRGG